MINKPDSWDIIFGIEPVTMRLQRMMNQAERISKKKQRRSLHKYYLNL